MSTSNQQALRLIRTIPFREIPGHSKLFIEYLAWQASVHPFYQRAPDINSVARLASEVLPHVRYPRREIARILKRQNACFGSDVALIEELEKPDCVAVLTGQQAGLFAGPLYTIYKALTAIRIAENLRTKGIPAVPIFWMDTDDHDLAEVTRVKAMASDSSIHIADYREMLFKTATDSNHPVGSIRMPANVQEAIDYFVSTLPGSTGKDSIKNLLNSTYSPGNTFAQGFGKLMAHLFRKHRLILFDPRDPEAKFLGRGIFQKALREADRIGAALTARNRALEAAGFHAQVKILEASTPLFLDAAGDRRPLMRHGNEFLLKHENSTFSLAELLSVAQSTPERFSPSVLLRPIYQDRIFPTVAYIGGPSEIAYFAQAEVLYRIFERPMPVIRPRVSCTLLQRDVRDSMERHGIEFEDCFAGRQALIEKMLRLSSASNTAEMLHELRENLNRKIEDIRPAVVKTDATLGPALENARRKIMHQVESLHGKFIQFEARRNSLLASRVDIILNHCFPDGSLQERALGLFHFAAWTGSALIEDIYACLDFDSFSHQLISL